MAHIRNAILSKFQVDGDKIMNHWMLVRRVWPNKSDEGHLRPSAIVTCPKKTLEMKPRKTRVPTEDVWSRIISPFQFGTKLCLWIFRVTRPFLFPTKRAPLLQNKRVIWTEFSSLCTPTAVAVTRPGAFQNFDDAADICIPNVVVQTLGTSDMGVEYNGVDYGFDPDVSVRFTDSEQGVNIVSIARIQMTGGNELIIKLL